MKRTTLTSTFIPVSLVVMLLLGGCSSKETTDANMQVAENQSASLLAYFQENGDFINTTAPAIMTASELNGMLSRNILIIDLRAQEDFDAGHIEGAVRLTPGDVPAFFENDVDAPSFERIVFVCNRGQISSYVAGIMRLLGYGNTWAVRYGMSAWNQDAAASGWDKATGDHPEKLTSDEPAPLDGTNELPVITVEASTGGEIARQRAMQLLSKESSAHLISFSDLMKDAEKYTIVAYVPADWYQQMKHPEGAIQFTPKASLGAEAELYKLMPGKPVAVYCFNGHHSAQAAAYLRMLGYDAYSVTYGANGFMHSAFSREEQATSRYWSDLQKNSFPVKKGPGDTSGQTNKPAVVKQAQGGCA